MIWPAALSGAALRDLRTAAGRRALEVALLVGGLFVLGFLCGAQAHAAETTTTASTTTASTTTASTTTASTTTVAAPAVTTSTVTGLTGSASAGHEEPVAEVPSVDKALHPVRGLVKSVADGLAEAQRQVPPLPPVSSAPPLPDLPGASDGTDLPGLPALPGQVPPKPVTSTPLPAGQAPQTSHPPVSSADERGQTSHRHAHTAATATYGPLPATVRAGDTAHADTSRPARPGHVPEQHAPGGGSSGVLVGQAALGNGTSRHGDGHAVTPRHPVQPALMPGTTTRTDATGTRDRYRDIPVFPA
ncbi:hypothetical protein ACGFNV_10090 [Streptomyces sp. NPDC048751]|uniref:hypothetical protein n=1 Tax=Streptomyces sp. NPDC048751 TaxID=3365591 RepID=UPI00371F1C8B